MLIFCANSFLFNINCIRHGFVLERDFRLVLALAGWSGETRPQERAVDTLVKHYRIAPSSSHNGASKGNGQREQPRRQRAVPVAPEATAAANAAASTYGDDDVGFPANCLTWPINYERCAYIQPSRSFHFLRTLHVAHITSSIRGSICNA